MTQLIIRHPGILTTVQDNGRYGFQRYGMPVSGVMDTYSYRLGNLLVGNLLNEACLETTLSGPHFECTDDCCIALTGADMSPMINNAPIPLYTPIFMKKGDVFSSSFARNGCRMYIAVAGGIDVPVVMNSRSTYVRAKLGGHEGRQLRTGDNLHVGSTTQKPLAYALPNDYIPLFEKNSELRIIPGPEASSFTFEGIRRFLTTEHIVSDQSDRMGYRLHGATIDHKTKADIISSGITAGTVQVPGNGQPIILLADRQTTGGYTRIAHVISVDLPRLAQLKPGNTIRFREVSLECAQELLRNEMNMLRMLMK